MPCSRRRHDVSQIEDYNIFNLVFRWEVHIATKACQEQGISFLLVVMETIRGLHTVAKEHIQGIVAALTRYQGIGKHVVVFSWRNFKCFEKCCLLLWLASGYLTVTELNHLLYHHLFSDALMTSKMSTNPLNSFFFDFMKFSDGLHDLHGEEGDLLLLARMGDSLHLPSESWLQYCNHLSKKNHAAAFQQFQQLLRNHLNQSHINRFT